MSVIKVSGTSLGGITVSGGTVTVQEWPGILAGRYEVALPDLVATSWPNLTGVRVPRQFSVGLLLHGTSAAAFYSLFEAVAAVVETTATVTLTREYTDLGGTDSKTASAVYLGGLEPTMKSHAAGVCVPRWQLLAEWA